MLHSLPHLLKKCGYRYGTPCQFFMQLTLAIVAIAFGLLLTFQPKRIIKAQKVFYRIFNWNIEPISMNREILIMRIIGISLISVGALSIICMFLL